ncbi:hypothetical protein OH76DRAFT_1222152 [Lentinus brumalis]|uniref:F-box domain-containing protein n=1 Tax=Lentinus brumalis TaxID=2498619 RepID=A0A371DLP6_9APHY|nr:hypothetical protein OH76DRAFT_1222152 [Polyporus brumalis]
MHEALCISEILLHICAFADDRTLAVLARCCSPFHECATRVLWHHLRSLAPLVRCFPSNMWRERGGEQEFVRPPGPKDWPRVLHYLRHVRRLERNLFDKTSLPKLHPQVLWMIAALNPALILLPNLRRFAWTHWSCIPTECIPALLSLFPADVRHIALGKMSYLPDILPSISSYITDKFICLDFLKLTFASSGISAPELSLPLLTHSLTQLHCGSDISFDKESFNLLSQLPNLRSLSCMLPDIRSLSSSAGDSVSVPFPALQTLQITATAHCYSAFTKIASLQGVHTVQLTFTEVVTVQQLPLLFAAIRRQFSPSTLTSLTVLVTHRADTERLILVPSHMSPLLIFRRLLMFNLRVHGEPRLDDEACSEMAHAWPHIQSLTITSSHPLTDDIHGLPTLGGLVPFAVFCPHLTYLKIRFNAQDIQQTTLSFPHRLERPSLTNLCVHCCPISRPHSVAAFLARMFPRLTNVNAYGFEDTGSGPEWMKDWAEVRRYLPLFADIRADERQWVEVERKSEAGRRIEPVDR